MATLVLDCPHCLSKSVTVDVAGATPSYARGSAAPRVWNFVGFCRRCAFGVSLLADISGIYHTFGHISPERVVKMPDDITGVLRVGKIWPEPPEANVPDSLPGDVDRAFREADASRAAGQNESAAMMYRKAIERGVNRLHGFENALEEKKATLAGVVKKLASESKLTPAIADWADHVRLLGNDGAHEEEAPEDAEIEDLANLTRMALIYLFEMPARVKKLREGQPSGEKTI